MKYFYICSFQKNVTKQIINKNFIEKWNKRQTVTSGWG